MDASLLSTPSVEMSRIEVSRRTVAAWAAGIRVITPLAMPLSLSHLPGEATSKTNGRTSVGKRHRRRMNMKEGRSKPNHKANRRSFLKKGVLAAGAATAGAGLLATRLSAVSHGPEEKSGRLTPGDAALLRFAAAAEILETDFWVQYNELGGVPNTSEVPGGSGNPAYTAALTVLDSDMAQYIHDNTDDEFTHQNFLNAYLESKGASPVNLEPFRTLPGSTATGSSGKLRLTNLTQLTLDTSWWTRYRDSAHNPDLDAHINFPQAVPGLSTGKFTAIPRTNADLTPDAHLQAIA